MNKLLQINSVANSGSTGRIAEQIGSKAIENNWRSFIAYGRYANPSSSELIKIGSKKDFYGHVFKSFVLAEHGLGSEDATLQLIEKIEEIQPDIIHLHNIHGYYINYKELFEYLKIFNGHIFWTLHDCWSFTGHCSYFSDVNCTKWINGCNTCPKINSYPKSLILDTSEAMYLSKKLQFCNIDNLHIITVSDWLKNLVSQSFLNKHVITTIYNGVDLAIFKPKVKSIIFLERYILHDKFIMLTAATTWTKSKGYEDYLQLSALLQEDEIIIMIGLDDDKIKKLPSNIIGIRKTESQLELSDWYNMADLVLNLSYQETFGMTSAEGFSCGKPSIVYNATASPELVTRNELGYIVEPGQIKDVYKAILEVKKNGADFYSITCRNIAEEKYDKDKQFQKYVDLYKKYVNN
jgi:glycosyltransferase involved in cell wall biosynthesis